MFFRISVQETPEDGRLQEGCSCIPSGSGRQYLFGTVFKKSRKHILKKIKKRREPAY